MSGLSPSSGTPDVSQLLRTDPLSAAESITGKSYKEDERTSRLGLLLHIEHGQAKREALQATGDTHYSMGFDEALRVFQDLGFAEVLRDAFVGQEHEDGAPSELFVVMWHMDGILATAESYGGERLNTATVLYNWRPNDLGDLVHYTSSGHLSDDGVWAGHHDAREGLRHNLEQLRRAGAFLPRWVEQPFLWLLTYMDTKCEGYDHGAITAGRVARLPDHVRAAIGEAP